MEAHRHRSPNDPTAEVSLDERAETAGNRTPAGSYWIGLLQRTFLLLSIYVLSIGPMYWQWYDGKFVTGSPIIAAFYEPLVIAASYMSPFGEWLDWYINLWIG